MPVNPKNLKISLIPRKYQRLLEFGREHRMHTLRGTLNAGSIGRKVIEFLLDLRVRKDIEDHLKTHGGTFLDLIDRALKNYITNSSKEK